VDCSIDIAVNRSAEELRETWQVRALIASRHRQIGMMILSALAHSYDDAMPVLLRVAFPGFSSISLPFLTTAGKIDKCGRVVADIATRDGLIIKDIPVFPSELAMRNKLRIFADKLKLSDTDRIEMFKCVQRWVVADRRLDPMMDPKDPDAKRLTTH
jgi:hypothetical protein